MKTRLLFTCLLLSHLSFCQMGLPVGVQAKPFVQNDTAGNPVSLSMFKGKYVLIEFWASWCGPCREENPNLVKAYKKYHSKGLEILSVSLDEDQRAWINAIRKDGLFWTHVSDLKSWKNEVAQQYNINAIPFNLLVNPEGIIVARLLKREKLFQKLGEIFGGD